MPKNSRKRERSPYRHIYSRENYEEIPEEFFCPISKKFMSDPVRIPKSHITYDRNSVKDLHKPEDLLPDLRMRNIMEDWFSHYDLCPPFDFISNQDDLVVAMDSVLKQRKSSLLLELASAIRSKPSLMKNGGCILCVATLLSCPNPSANWVLTTLSIVAHVDDDVELLVPNTGIHPEYSLLDPIKNILDSDLSDNEEFQIGFVMLLHGLVVNSPDIVPMARKLEKIIEALVIYMWPVPEHFIVGWYQKLLITLELLSENEENCRRMVEVGIIEMLFVTLKSVVSSMEEIRDNPDNVSASVAIETVVKIFDKLCQRSQEAREKIRRFFQSEINLFCRALFNYVKTTEASVAGARFLAHFMDESGNGFNINTLS